MPTRRAASRPGPDRMIFQAFLAVGLLKAGAGGQSMQLRGGARSNQEPRKPSEDGEGVPGYSLTPALMHGTQKGDSRIATSAAGARASWARNRA